MKKLFLVFAVVCLAAPAAWALTGTYGWEDCGTILGMSPANIFSEVSNVTDMYNSGTHSLKLVHALTPTGTSQAYVAWIKGLTAGDVVTGEFYAYDLTATSNPSARIWAHYANSTDVNSYYGSASGSMDYSGTPVGWGIVPNTSGHPYAWTFAATSGLADAIIIEVRTYGYAAGVNTLWIDDLSVTAPDRAGVSIAFPAPGPSATEPGTWGSIKALYR
ncbi:MAG TPA: hypothetical protein VMU02_09615 [bacterium]|nr:hypothetical protein [bacterium]